MEDYRKLTYQDDNDYTTNAPSYYDALARFTKALKELTLRMDDVEKRFKDLIMQWYEDGTLADLLEQLMLQEYARKDWTIEQLNKLSAEIEKTLESYATKEWVENLVERIEISVTVGATGDYKTINEALDFIIKKPTQPLHATITLLPGFVMKEQVSIDAMDLSYITIKGDSTITIDRNSITKVLIESRRPAFFGNNNAILPIIDCLFQYNTGTSTSGFDGITVANGSKVQLTPGSGVNKADRGLGAYYNSEAYGYMGGLTEGGMGAGAGDTTGVQFKDCTNRALMATYGSHIKTPRAQLQNNKGDYCVYVIWDSSVDVYQSDMSYAQGTALTCRDASTANARESNVSHSDIGYHALHGGIIDARSLITSPWVGESAQYCKRYGALASYASTIELQQANVSNAEENGIHASDGSTINAGELKANNCGDLAISAFRTGTINADSAEAKEAGSAAVLADYASTINAANVKATNSKDHAILARHGSRISATGADVSYSPKGFVAYNGSNISADRSKADNNTTGYEARFGSTIDAEQATANNCTNKGFIANEASTINAVNAKANNINSLSSGQRINQSIGFVASRSSNLNCRGGEAKNCQIGVMAYEGSSVNASSVDASGSNDKGFEVYRGSFLTAVNSTGSLSQTEQAMTQDGVIFYYVASE